MGRFLPPDHSKGDERTLGGYTAVHARPPAFEGRDGRSYSVSIETDATGDAAAPVGAYLLFVQWSPGEPRVSGHLETDFLERAATEDEARERVGALPLERVREMLDALIAERAPNADRPWWDVMRDEDGA
ncbi:MAG TPA: hypothetical protein VFW04_09250 [Gemmatimonadaceae bacterium]|nr:hypothetical protein [Gemmatimonadaceae bacterium]